MNAILISNEWSRLVSDLAPFISAAAWALLHFIWQGSVLAIAYFIAASFLKRSSASSRYLAGCATLLMMAITPFATFAWMLQDASLGLHADSSSLKAAGGSASLAATPPDALHMIIVAAWLLGIACFAVWVMGGWAQAQRFRSMGSLPMSSSLAMGIDRLGRTMNVRCIVKIIDHAMVAAPLTFGAIKPVILLPASMLCGLSPAQLEAIIAHEMAHIRRRDYLVNLLQTAVESLLFFHPAVWWVSRQIRQEREYCCDDLAAATCGNPVDYARALAQLESLRSDAPRLGLSSQGGSLMKRIARLVGSPEAHARSRLIATTWSMGAAITLLAAASTALAAVRPTDKPIIAEPPVVEVVGEALPQHQYLWHGALSANAPHAAACEFAAAKPAASCDACHVGVPQDDDGVWVVAGTELAEGEWTGEIEASRFLLLNAVAGAEGVVALTAEDGSRIEAAQVAWQICLQPTIDPEKMPSNGLLQAAKLAYPYNLLQLMPWVAPEAHDVLVVPEVEAVQPAMSTLWRRAAPLVLDAPIHLDLMLHRRAAVTAERMRFINALDVVQGECIEGVGEQVETDSPVEVEGIDGVWQLQYEVEPIVEFEGDVVIETAKPQPASRLLTLARLLQAQPAAPAPKP